MNARRGGDLPSFALEPNLGRLPVLESHDGGPGGEFFRSIGCCKDMASVQEFATLVVEIVGVILVRKEDSIDGGQLSHGEGRADGGFETESRHDGKLGPSWTEGGVREEYDAVYGEDDGRGGDVGDGNVGHGGTIEGEVRLRVGRKKEIGSRTRWSDLGWVFETSDSGAGLCCSVRTRLIPNHGNQRDWEAFCLQPWDTALAFAQGLGL